MRTAIVRVGTGLGLAVVATGVVFVTGMRAKSPPVVNTVRKLGRTTRPLLIRSAGTPGAAAAVVRHVGRSSGREYETPVVAVPTDDGYVVALPYGPVADWTRNVLAGGPAAIVHDGVVHEVAAPTVVPLAAVGELFSPADQRAHRLFGVAEALRVRTVAADTEEPQPSV